MDGVLVGVVHILCQIRHVIVKVVCNICHIIVNVDWLVYLCNNLGGGLRALSELFERIVVECRHFRLPLGSYPHGSHFIFQLLFTGCCSNSLARR
jgi:hypothetical protein